MSIFVVTTDRGALKKLALIEIPHPSLALPADGGLTQARPLVDQGMIACLHVSSETLLDLLLMDGA